MTNDTNDTNDEVRALGSELAEAVDTWLELRALLASVTTTAQPVDPTTVKQLVDGYLNGATIHS